MAQKVGTERKMKLRQGTTSLGQIATETAKPRINDKEPSFGSIIYHQSECQDEVISINFTWSVSLQMLNVDHFIIVNGNV